MFWLFGWLSGSIAHYQALDTYSAAFGDYLGRGVMFLSSLIWLAMGLIIAEGLRSAPRAGAGRTVVAGMIIFAAGAAVLFLAFFPLAHAEKYNWDFTRATSEKLVEGTQYDPR